MVNGWLHPPTAWVLFLQPPWHTTCSRAWPGERLVEHSPECDCRKPEQTALIDGISGEVTSREKLREGILRMSSSFQNLLEPGSTVAVSLPNIPQVVHGSTFCPSVLSHRQLNSSSSTCCLCLGQYMQVLECVSSTQSTPQRRPGALPLQHSPSHAKLKSEQSVMI